MHERFRSARKTAASSRNFLRRIVICHILSNSLLQQQERGPGLGRAFCCREMNRYSKSGPSKTVPRVHFLSRDANVPLGHQGRQLGRTFEPSGSTATLSSTISWKI